MTDNKETFDGTWTRRKFLTKVGIVGGAAALYETMVAMGMINTPTAWAGTPKLKANVGVGKSVLILGAGIGGLTTAYILGQYGYRCEIIEASNRAGGRNHTARRGSTIIEKSEANGTTFQECMFDDGLYLNLGPGRLPYHHRRVLGYCQQLGVELEPYIMNTTGNLFQSTDDQFTSSPKVYREIQNDTRGYIAELLAKCVNKGALDEELSADDKANLLSLLQTFGPLGQKHTGCGEENPDYNYEGSTRTGCADDVDGKPTPNVFYNCQIPQKSSLNDLLDSKFWQNSFYDPVEFEWQPTLFQPVGGMDKIVDGFVRAIGDIIRFNAPVTEIQNVRNGVEVTYMDGNREVTKRADFCASNIPCPILKRIKNNFSRDFQDAIARTTFDASCKVGWQTNTRFWEDQKYEIYGGISWTNDIIEQIWYPSNDYFKQKGTLTGAYIHDGTCEGEPRHATEFGNYSLEKRLAVAKEGGARLHDEFEDNSIVPTELGVSIAWQHVVHAEGAWPLWASTGQHDNADYRRLLTPDGNVFIVGDQASTLPGWQEGAMMSAEHVVEMIGGLKERVVPEGVEAPNTFKVTRGHF
ncbi:MAG: flavin monoamine oxidase [Lysobacteraceae bacterium]|nr:MAG: flavin monoamine oxidase [Xanthomonadaceae bacterium]